ncbi:hypothetical protein Bcop_1524 [Bacteroides coprosuis DSM 18011]|uniref:Uncharacterized protein n=1 Tax=Bacteroides coprosuis DSM 18011 TaxID=679937 RepID=F3ZQ52_9BACE|nr:MULTISPECIES: hypothetical protein [Bacteroides]EGJ71718.1 hypothetical protein Bcop_1524 [Bacteroides coprosuis DSM 18011]HJD92155.1 hypothetical protein [Bacteroides coprosuis]
MNPRIVQIFLALGIIALAGATIEQLSRGVYSLIFLDIFLILGTAKR